MTRAHRESRRSGFSLLEILVALAILGLGAGVVLTRSSNAISRVTEHAVFFDFQRTVSDLRRDAWRAQAPVVVLASRGGPDPSSPPGEEEPDQTPADGASAVTVALKEGWTYRLSQPFRIEASGRCPNLAADLVHDGKVRVHLITRDNACHFIRTVEIPR